MMCSLTLVYSYYRNPGMLRIHYETWATYPQEVKDQIEAVIVDDGSPDPAVEVERPEGLPALRIFRITEDKPWNQHAARNWGAHHARGQWLFLSDMDHVLPAGSAELILAMPDPTRAYTLRRLDAPSMEPKLRDGREHPHPNSFVMTREMYWRIGGYDEDFCGIYGTDGLFRSHARMHARFVHTDIPIVRFSREVQPDASTSTLGRKESRDPDAKRNLRRRKKEQGIPMTVLSDECVRVV